MEFLDIPVILAEMLKMFSSSELIQLSNVSHLWKTESRKVLRARMNVVRAQEPMNPCRSLRDFKLELDGITDRAYSGVGIFLNGSNHRGHCTEVADGVLLSILDQLESKCLSIEINGLWTSLVACPALLLVQRILQQQGATLQRLSINLEYEQEVFIGEFLHGCTFPNLRILIFGDKTTQQVSSTNLIKALVNRSPSLCVLHTNSRVNLRSNLLEGSRAAHVTATEYSPFYDEIPEVFVSQLSMERLRLISTGRRFRFGRFNRIAEGLLRSSHTALRVLSTDVLFLVHLMSFGTPLERLTKLNLHANFAQLDLSNLCALTALKNCDFSHVFPFLKEINCFVYSNPSKLPKEMTRRLIQSCNANQFRPNASNSANIKSLILHCPPDSTALKEFHMRNLSQIFPHVHTLKVKPHKDENIPFRILWRQYWNDVKEIQVHNFGHNSSNLDDQFCGFSDNQLGTIRKLSSEQLHNLKIEPHFLSITQLQGLRALKLFCSGLEWRPRDETYLLSAVTGELAFKKCPNLRVLVTTDRYEQVLQHLKPYADVLVVDEQEVIGTDDVYIS